MNLYNDFLNKKGNIEQATFLWNMVASILNAGMSALLLIVVTRVSGPKEAGVFSLAFSIAQLMLTIGYFDMRPYQVTDVKKKISFSVYLSSRVLTCSAMIFISIIYVAAKSYDRYKSLLIILLCLLKMFDALEDVIHGMFQQNGRLDVASKFQSIRLVCAMLIFSLVLIVSKNVVAACVSAILTTIIFLVLLNFPMIGLFEKVNWNFNKKQLVGLFVACTPLFIGSFLSLYIGNAPKYAINQYMTDEYQAYYNILFMPSYVVNLCSGFIFRPLLTPLSQSWHEGNKKRFRRIICKLLVSVLFLTCLAYLGAFICGIPILETVYNIDLQAYKGILLILILGGGIGAAGIIIYYALTVMRKQQFLLICYAITAIAAFCLSPVLVRCYGLWGAAFAYVISIGIQGGCFGIIFLICYRYYK